MATDNERKYEPTQSPDDNWLDAIGPEEMSRERVIENLEEFGFDLADDDEQLSLESSGQEFGGAYQNGAYTDVEEVGDLIDENTPLDADEPSSFRPVEDNVLDDISGNNPQDDEMPTGGTQPSGLQ